MIKRKKKVKVEPTNSFSNPGIELIMMIMNEVDADVDASVDDDDDDDVNNNNDIAGINQHKWQKRKRIKQSNQNKTENV